MYMYMYMYMYVYVYVYVYSHVYIYTYIQYTSTVAVLRKCPAVIPTGWSLHCFATDGPWGNEQGNGEGGSFFWFVTCCDQFKKKNAKEQQLGFCYVPYFVCGHRHAVMSMLWFSTEKFMTFMTNSPICLLNHNFVDQTLQQITGKPWSHRSDCQPLPWGFHKWGYPKMAGL